MNLKPGGSKNVTVRFTRPDGLATGDYDYIAAATADGTNTAAAEAVTAAPVAIEAPVVDLSTAFADEQPIHVNPGRPSRALVTVTNDGNVTAAGTLGLTLYASSDATLDAGDTVLTELPTKKVHLRAGKAMKLRVRFTSPEGLAAGSYVVIASVTPTVQPADDNGTNDVAVTETA